MIRCRLICLSLSTGLLSACNQGLLATVGPDYQPPAPVTISQWQAPVPEVANPALAHQGKASDLLQWWDGFNDPVLSQLLASAEKVNDNIASALARIEQTRASVVGADSALMPSLDGSLAAGRSSFSFGGPAFLRTQYSAGLQSSWELDLFGGLARQQEANLSQLASRTASWHDARVSVAVELANAYVNFRYCEIQSQQLLADTLSRKTTADYTRISSEQGFLSGNDLALALASNSDGQKALSFQQGQCQRFIKGLVQLTGLEENAITLAISAHPEQQTKLPTPPAFNLRSLPAQVISQRPDIAAAERDMAEASANIGVEQAKRYPKLSLSGNITPTLQSMNSSALALAQTWSIGPTLNLPLFDGGKKAANVESAKAQYELAATRYQTKVRTAIKEVEESLVRLDTAKQRLPLAQQSAEHYQQVFSANQILFNNGLINGLELETARRNQLSAELAIKEMEQERISAWIALYRAVGGGWQASESATNSDSSSNTPSNQAHSIAGQS